MLCFYQNARHHSIIINLEGVWTKKVVCCDKQLFYFSFAITNLYNVSPCALILLRRGIPASRDNKVLQQQLLSITHATARSNTFSLPGSYARPCHMSTSISSPSPTYHICRGLLQLSPPERFDVHTIHSTQYTMHNVQRTTHNAQRTTHDDLHKLHNAIIYTLTFR